MFLGGLSRRHEGESWNCWSPSRFHDSKQSFHYGSHSLQVMKSTRVWWRSSPPQLKTGLLPKVQVPCILTILRQESTHRFPPRKNWCWKRTGWIITSTTKCPYLQNPLILGSCLLQVDTFWEKKVQRQMATYSSEDARNYLFIYLFILSFIDS
jgi:hypothetical protein